VGAVEYALFAERIESIVDAFEALLMCMAFRRGSYVGELGVGEVVDLGAVLCDGGAYSLSNLEVPTGLIERCRCILGSVCARRISSS